MLLLGISLRLIRVAEPYIVDCHSWRQSDTAAFTHNYLTVTLNPLDPRVDRYPCQHRGKPFGRVEAELPVGAWLAALPLAARGVTCPPAPYLRAVSILFFVGACLYLFLLVRELTQSPALAVLTVFAFSLLPLSLFFTRTVQPEAPGLFFSLAFLYHLSCWLRGSSWRQAAISGVFGTLALLQKVSNAVVLAPAAYLIIMHEGFWTTLKRPRYYLWALGMLIPVAAWAHHARSFAWSFGVWAGSGKYTSWKDFTTAHNWEFFSTRALFEVLTWSGLILLVLGLTRLRESKACRFASVWLGAQLLFLVLAMPVNRTHSYYQLPMELPAAMLIALGAQRLWDQRWAGRVVLGALLALHAAQLVHPLTAHYHTQDLRLRDGIALLRRRVPAEETIVSSDRHPALFTNSCVRGWFLKSPDIPAIDACAEGTRYLLLDAPTRFKLARAPQKWRELERRYVELERTRHFSVWKRR